MECDWHFFWRAMYVILFMSLSDLSLFQVLTIRTWKYPQNPKYSTYDVLPLPIHFATVLSRIGTRTTQGDCCYPFWPIHLKELGAQILPWKELLFEGLVAYMRVHILGYPESIAGVEKDAYYEFRFPSLRPVTFWHVGVPRLLTNLLSRLCTRYTNLYM